MQTIDVNYSNGVGPFTIYVCNISLDYCDLIATNVSLPPTYTFDLPPEFLGTLEVVVKIIDLLSMFYSTAYHNINPNNNPI